VNTENGFDFRTAFSTKKMASSEAFLFAEYTPPRHQSSTLNRDVLARCLSCTLSQISFHFHARRSIDT
jgi:hypothetical protein